MSTFRLFGAAVILSAAVATPALAQQVIQEPGYCAFFYPNANCTNKGPGNPYTDTGYQRGSGPYAGMPSSGAPVRVAAKRPRVRAQ